ncbi:hypothetical protein BCL76_10994 [Streptomyces sp. CG 926]|uniref:hypothetical protein n=1 Tax=Streptomyces sp. CG 926 TaxID=1882405 RepID=UPI000D6C1866|nr:hypothetical protein [Streptomyces sp. CG 926]PWK67189.1 hypothetical protein BCL76_10994 [Streptomyces sp. CG 926]
MDAMEKARQTRRTIIEQRRHEAAAKVTEKAGKRDRFKATGATALINGVVFVVSALMFSAAAWSAGHLVASIPGVPPMYAWGAFSAVEGAWLACVLLMVKWQNDTDNLYRVNKAEALARKAYWGSLALNFAHGFVLTRSILTGALAGLALCIFPYAFKELFSVAITNRVEELRHIGLGEVLAERYQLSALARFHEADQDRAAEHAPRAATSTEHEHPEQPSTHPEHARPVLARPEQQASTPLLAGDEQRAATPSMAELAREQLASGTSRPDVVASILQAMPNAKPESVKAEVRRQAKKLEGTGQYL